MFKIHIRHDAIEYMLAVHHAICEARRENKGAKAIDNNMKTSMFKANRLYRWDLEITPKCERS